MQQSIAGEAGNRYFVIMNKSIRLTFLLIALVQGMHSMEEYAGKLWEVYPPAKFVCGLVSDDHENAFIIINIILFIVLVLIWAATFSKSFSVRAALWFWAIMETLNGIGHSLWSLMQGSYTPGLITAPILLLLGLNMIRLLRKIG